eukprot:1355899-Pyramimonas_sp.AAC.1
MGSSTEAPSGTAHMRPPCPIWHFHPSSTALRGSIRSSTEAPRGTTRMRPPNTKFSIFTHPVQRFVAP